MNLNNGDNQLNIEINRSKTVFFFWIVTIVKINELLIDVCVSQTDTA